MKIVLSRRGFDSALGGVASPILPDGSMLSLPIPDPSGPTALNDLRPNGVDIAKVASDLTRGRITGSTHVHLDPDLIQSTLPRREGWRPAFGQCSAAQRHLHRYGVGVGDLFLFFGWFRQVEQVSGRFRYARGAPDLHVVFGWLEVGEVLFGDALRAAPDWLSGHPHLDGTERAWDHIYVAPPRGSMYSAGAGAVRRFCGAVQLTATGATSRSHWRLPDWFAPRAGRPPLTYHSNPARWKREGGDVLLATVGRGQEFILDSECYPEAPDWASSLIAVGT